MTLSQSLSQNEPLAIIHHELQPTVTLSQSPSQNEPLANIRQELQTSVTPSESPTQNEPLAIIHQGLEPSDLVNWTSAVLHDPAPVPPRHTMVTRSQDGSIKPNPKFTSPDFLYSAELIPHEPKTIKSALKHPGWLSAMQEELSALHANGTWELVPRTPTMNFVGCKWVYKTKLHGDGSLECLKARLVAKGYTQVPGVDFSKTFSPVIKLASIRLILSIALARN